MNDLPQIQLHGFRVNAITESQCVTRVLDALDAGLGGFIVTPNLDHMRRLVLHKDFAQVCALADIVVPDGMPLIWAARLQGTPLPERVAGSSLISTLSAGAATRGRSIFLLGGAGNSAACAAEKLLKLHPNLRIAGTYCPEFGFEKDARELDRIIQLLKEANPDIVYVGIGSPKQENFIVKVRSQLPKTWWLGIGVSFSFVAGDVRRAPKWMQRTGLEWMHRLFQEPKRLARRYLIEDIPFAIKLFGAALRLRILPAKK